MSKSVYLDFLGTREHVQDVPDDYHFGAAEASAALPRKSRWLSIESVTEDTHGIYVRCQLLVVRAALSPFFWWMILRGLVAHLRNWKIG